MSRKEYKLDEGIDTRTSSLDNIYFDVNGHGFAAVSVAHKTNEASQGKKGWMLFRNIKGDLGLPVTNDVYDNIRTIEVRRNGGKLDTYFFVSQEFIVCSGKDNDTIYSVDQRTGDLTKMNKEDGKLYMSNAIRFSSSFVFTNEHNIEEPLRTNILTPDGFMFKESVDEIGVKSIENEEIFNGCGLVAVKKNGKFNLFEDRSLIPVMKEFADDIKVLDNPFNLNRPLILVKYREGLCDIFEVATLKPIFGMSIEDIYTNEEGYIFFNRKGKIHLFISPNEYIKCNNCVECGYGELIYLDDGYMFYFSGRLSDKFDEVYDIKSLFPIVTKNGKYNFLERTTGKPVFDTWFDDVDPYEGDDDTTYNGKAHNFTVYENGEKKTLTYSPRPNFSIA